MDEQTTSPVPAVSMTTQTQVHLNFYDALKEVMDGKNITRLEWNDVKVFGSLVNGRLMIMLGDGQLHDWIISDGDMSALDWVVI